MGSLITGGSDANTKQKIEEQRRNKKLRNRMSDSDNCLVIVIELNVFLTVTENDIYLVLWVRQNN